ncbi:MAG: hypothetical protein K2X27_04725 [Candidatus Obscuribacterales bacterium]|nr:hypothetical protein [Candidatus Obscuribacterales bacterium]
MQKKAKRKSFAKSSTVQHYQHLRDRKGMMLVELMVSIVMSLFISIALYDSYSLAMRGTSYAQNQTIAASIAQSAVDQCRDQTWPDLQTMVANSPQTLVISGAQSALASGRPLGRDTDLTYSAKSQALVFNGTCVRTVTQTGGANGPITITANVNWRSGTSNQTVVATSVITANGFHN